MTVAKVTEVTPEIAPFCEIAKQVDDLRNRLLYMQHRHPEIIAAADGMTAAIEHLSNYIGYRALYTYRYGVFDMDE